jgi:hypothetical protein
MTAPIPACRCPSGFADRHDVGAAIAPRRRVVTGEAPQAGEAETAKPASRLIGDVESVQVVHDVADPVRGTPHCPAARRRRRRSSQRRECGEPVLSVWRHRARRLPRASPSANAAPSPVGYLRQAPTGRCCRHRQGARSRRSRRNSMVGVAVTITPRSRSRWSRFTEGGIVCLESGAGVHHVHQGAGQRAESRSSGSRPVHDRGNRYSCLSGLARAIAHDHARMG